MTKIKDLATVCVDNMFRLVPVDEERYELFVHLDNWLQTIADSNIDDVVSTVPVFCNWALTDLFLKTQENILTSAVAAKRVWEAIDQDNLPLIVRDRARRYFAAIHSFDVAVGHAEDGPWTLSHYIDCMWICILLRMRMETGFIVHTCLERQRRFP